MYKEAPNRSTTRKPNKKDGRKRSGRIGPSDGGPRFPAASSTNAPTKAPRKKKDGPDSVRMMGYMARRGS